MNGLACIVQLNDENGLHYFDGSRLHPLKDPDDVVALNMVAKATIGHDLPALKVGNNRAPFGTRLREAVEG